MVVAGYFVLSVIILAALPNKQNELCKFYHPEEF
jgi:hypothetical protein